MSSYILGLVGGFYCCVFFSFSFCLRGCARVRSFCSLVGEDKITYVRITADIFFFSHHFYSALSSLETVGGGVYFWIFWFTSVLS